MAIKFLIGEYRLLWEALKRHQAELERLSASAASEDEQLLIDDKLQKMDDMFKTIAQSAKADWDLELP